MAKRTTEDYERLLKELAAQRDDASAVANRALQENKILRQDVLHGMEILTALLGGQPAAMETVQDLAGVRNWLIGVGYKGGVGGSVATFVGQLVERHLQATNILQAVHSEGYRPNKALVAKIRSWVAGTWK